MRTTCLLVALVLDKLEKRPGYILPIIPELLPVARHYAAGTTFKEAAVPVDAPPMFVVAATDDQLGLVPVSVALYEKRTGTPPYILRGLKNGKCTKKSCYQDIFLEICQGRNRNPAGRSRLQMVLGGPQAHTT
jgi:hypothetical protein